MANIFNSAVAHLRRYGLRAMYHHACVRSWDRWYEWWFDIRTSTPVDTNSDDGDSNHYRAIPYNSLGAIWRHVAVDPTQDVFLDYGCGKGRAVIVAATRPFKKVIGVELSSELASIARDNIRRAQSRLLCQDTSIITANALDFNIPGDVTVFHFFNPFQGAVLDSVIEAIRKSLAESPRRATILYANPRRFQQAIADRKWIVARDDVIWPHYESRVRRGDADGKFRYRIYDLRPEHLQA